MNALAVMGNQNLVTAEGMQELYNKFIGYLDASPKTIETYTKSLRAFFTWMAAKGISKPCFDDVKAYRDEIASNYKPTTVQAYMFAVRRFFTWTAETGLYPNVAGKLKGAKVSRNPKKDYLTSEQVQSIVSRMPTNSLEGLRNRAFFMLMVSCGLRDIEVSRANVEDLRTLGNATVLYVQGKGRDDKEEFVRIPGVVENAIRVYLKGRKDINGNSPLFASLSNNSYGKRMTTKSISVIVKRAMVEAGFNSDRLTAHSLRHTAVTLSLLNGASLQEVQQFARHTNINTTLIYSHNLEAMQNKCSTLVANSIFG